MTKIRGMNMKFHFENLGLLDEAKLELSDLTVICGENNTGKTYATYAIYGFLRSWRRLLHMALAEELEEMIQSQGKYQVDLRKMFAGKINTYLQRLEKPYKAILPKVFAAKEDFFAQSHFGISVDECKSISDKAFQRRIQAGPAGKVLATISKEEGTYNLEVLVADDDLLHSPFGGLTEFIADAIADTVFSPYFPEAHISSAERTGATIFRKELDVARTRMLKALNEMDSRDIKRSPWKLFQKIDADYAWPVEDNVEFVRQLEEVDKQTSELAKQYPAVLAAFDAIIGGSYKVIRNQGLVFQARGAGQRRFTMNEASSCVRALLDIGFYLRSKAKPGDLFIIDEPELNLHPRNQRSFARLVARLINAGIKVFITTHSDYLIKELNTLIMLNQRSEHALSVQEQYKYEDEELLDPQRVRLYMTGTERKASAKNGKRATRINTLKLAEIHRDRGIEVGTFDDTIDIMNQIQSDLLYGGEL